MFGSYSVINVVVLLNLLIAMMSNSYQIISERSDMEWKFARSKLWMSFFEDGGTVPPPFNIIPTPKFLKRMLSCRSETESSSIKVKEAAKRDAEYRTVMRCLIRRYVTSQQRKQEDQGVTEDDVNEVKQAVTSFRSELFDILRNNGMKGVSSSADTLSRKERLRERRLLKDFNIDLVESVMEAFMKEPVGAGKGSQQGFSLIRRMTGKRENAKKNWNQIVGAARSKQNPIGTTAHTQSGSLKELRDKVLKEQELTGKRRFAHAARRVLRGKYSEAEAIEEEPGSYSASTTPRSSITPQDETQKKEVRRKSADATAAKEKKKIEASPKKDAPLKKDAPTKREPSPRREPSPKREPSPRRDASPKKPADSASKGEPGKEPKTTPKKRRPSPDSAAKGEGGREPRKALPRRPPGEPGAKGEPGKEPKTTPKKAMPRRPSPDSAAKGEPGKERKTTPKKVLPRKPPEAGKEPSSSTAKEQKKMETTPKKAMPKKPVDSAAKPEAGKEPTKKTEPATKKEAPKRPPDSATTKVEVGKTITSTKDEKSQLPSTSTDKGVRKTTVGSTDEALKSRRSTDVVLDIETDASRKTPKPSPKPSPSRTQAKGAIDMPEIKGSGVKGLISSFDQKTTTTSKTEPPPPLAKSPARKTSAKVFPAEEPEPDSMTWI